MTFEELCKQAKYSPVHLGRCILKHPDSKPAFLAKVMGYQLSDSDIKVINKLQASKQFREEFSRKITNKKAA